MIERGRYKIENAKVSGIRIGTWFHDGRGFFSATFSGGGTAQGAELPFTREFVDEFIAACGASHLTDCDGKFVRVLRSGYYIDAVAHITDDDKVAQIYDYTKEKK